MLMVKKDNRLYFKSSVLDRINGISHCFTTKSGGESRGKISGLNLGFRVGDDADFVRSNYMHIAKDFNFPYEKITAAKQTHSTNVAVVTEANAGCGVSRLSETFEADALVTDTANIPLAVFYADCVPILLADTKKRAVAAVHSGWRGTADKIVQNVIKVMEEVFKSNPKDIIAAVGPSIGPCCFETGAEVAEKFPKELCTLQKDGKFRVDLWEANRRLLTASGVLPQNIDVFKLCTVCRNDILYSYRTNNESTGRMGAFIMLKNVEDEEDV